MEKRDKHIEMMRIYSFWLAIISGTMVGLILLVFYTKELFKENSWLIEIYKEHFVAAIGLPLCAVLALIVVIVFRNQDGNIKVSALGFKFEGSSGEIIMWVIIFLAEAIALKLLW